MAYSHCCNIYILGQTKINSRVAIIEGSQLNISSNFRSLKNVILNNCYHLNLEYFIALPLYNELLNWMDLMP